MCAKTTSAAAGFAISRPLDAKSRMQERYPIAEIDVATIEDHPNNGVYSMNAAEIKKLTESIRHDGLTNIPLVRKLDTGQTTLRQEQHIPKAHQWTQ